MPSTGPAAVNEPSVAPLSIAPPSIAVPVNDDVLDELGLGE
jgi:hypothetical protein